MKKEINVWRFQRLSEDIENRNWLKGYLLMETPKGNVKVTIEHRHISFWREEFCLTDEEIESRIIKIP